MNLRDENITLKTELSLEKQYDTPNSKKDEEPHQPISEHAFVLLFTLARTADEPTDPHHENKESHDAEQRNNLETKLYEKID